ncbi:small redox-active disulfide protein 1 [Archaeoglobus sulfaticallidus PM70-1]|uniref:Small redox-active disulfide protein 1 n=1 Tax=Archaeoglobus sulfaticallidus PM70-1 TaxID=387631 RepID=N0BAQ1_9EURY|nr:MJ0307 family thioredoxin [Archaeoglobus sulfaticallidus]AGK60689.1 small redox-active disulfide protein 1 [Archaeoglobus sulfaticallidus PM70-1]
MIKIKLLTSPTCPYCPMAADVVRKFVEKNKDVVAIEIPVNTDEGLKEAVKFGIRGVPALIINDQAVILGVPSMGELQRVVEQMRAY